MPLAPTRIIPITRKALFFDGVDDYADVIGTENFAPSELTVITLVKPRATENLRTIVGKGGWHPSSPFEFSLSWTVDKFEVHMWDSTGNQYAVRSADGLLSGVWYGVAFTWTLGTIKLYLDGSLHKTGTGPTDLYSTTYTINVGRSWMAARYLLGEIAYVLIYNRALSDDEIQQIYNDPDHPPKSGLVLWLHDTSIDVENNVWRDLSGKGNNATIYGATAVDVVRPATRVLDATRVIEPTR